MDTARAAKRTEGVEHVYLVYRRTKRYMPAAEDELLEVLEEGVEFKELLSPVSLDGRQTALQEDEAWPDGCFRTCRCNRDSRCSRGSG